MSAVVSMKREREKVAFADRLASIERVLKRSGITEPERLLAKLLTADEVADLLGLKLGTIRNMTSRRELPCVHLGKRAVRYRLADILALIESRSVAALG
jgi:excisionase family DNA binding protein